MFVFRLHRRFPAKFSRERIFSKQHVRGAGTAVAASSTRKGKDPFTPAAADEQLPQLGFQNRLSGGTEPSAMDDEYAPKAILGGLLKEMFKGFESTGCVHSVQIDMILYGKSALVKLLGDVAGNLLSGAFHIFRGL